MASIISAIGNIASGGLLDGVSKVIDSIRGKSPEDAAKLAELKEKYAEAFVAADEQLRMGQLNINLAEARSNSLFVAGARPSLIWMGSAAIGWNYVLGPFLAWCALLFGHHIPPLTLDTTQLLSFLGVLLGTHGADLLHAKIASSMRK